MQESSGNDLRTNLTTKVILRWWFVDLSKLDLSATRRIASVEKQVYFIAQIIVCAVRLSECPAIDES